MFIMLALGTVSMLSLTGCPAAEPVKDDPENPVKPVDPTKPTEPVNKYPPIKNLDSSMLTPVLAKPDFFAVRRSIANTANEMARQAYDVGGQYIYSTSKEVPSRDLAEALNVGGGMVSYWYAGSATIDKATRCVAAYNEPEIIDALCNAFGNPKDGESYKTLLNAFRSGVYLGQKEIAPAANKFPELADIDTNKRQEFISLCTAATAAYGINIVIPPEGSPNTAYANVVAQLRTEVTNRFPPQGGIPPLRDNLITLLSNFVKCDAWVNDLKAEEHDLIISRVNYSIQYAAERENIRQANGIYR